MVNFTCQVRAKHTQTIMLSNRTNQPWALHPIIEGEQWKGPEFIRVEAHQQNKPYEITYSPLVMNVDNRKDQVGKQQWEGEMLFGSPSHSPLQQRASLSTACPQVLTCCGLLQVSWQLFCLPCGLWDLNADGLFPLQIQQQIPACKPPLLPSLPLPLS